MPFHMIETFSWTTVNADLTTRYNSTNFSSSILAGGGRYGNNALRWAGANNSNFDFLDGQIGPTITCGFNRRFENIGAAGPIMDFADSLGLGFNIQFGVHVTAAGLLEARRGAAVVLGTGATALVNATYYEIQFEVFIDNAAGTFKVWLDGVLEINLSGIDTQALAANTCGAARWWGLPGLGDDRISDFWMKDTAGNLVPFQTSLKTPTADGTLLEWTPSAGATHFNLVDEVPPNSDVDYVESSTVGQRDLYLFSALPFNPATVFSVQPSLWAKDAVAGGQIAPLIRSGGSNFNGTTATLAITYADKLSIHDQNPNGPTTWTGTSVDAAQFGEIVIAAATAKRVSQAMVEVLHSVAVAPATPAAGGTTGKWFSDLWDDSMQDLPERRWQA